MFWAAAVIVHLYVYSHSYIWEYLYVIGDTNETNLENLVWKQILVYNIKKWRILYMEENLKYQPEYNLLQDAYLGSREVLQKKLLFLSNMENG